MVEHDKLIRGHLQESIQTDAPEVELLEHPSSSASLKKRLYLAGEAQGWWSAQGFNSGSAEGSRFWIGRCKSDDASILFRMFIQNQF